MKINKKGNQLHHGFTLIEMIGVLAVIAILAAVLIPKVFEAINNSRINNSIMGCQTMKTAVVDHYAKYQSLTTVYTNSALYTIAIPFPQFDVVLLQEQLTDKPFQTKISDPPAAAGTRLSLLAAPTSIGNAPGLGGSPVDAEFDLDGDGNNDVSGSVCAVAILPGVAMNDAWEVSRRLDGDTMSATDATSDDLEGRVKYGVSNTVTTVYVYLTHR